MIINIIKQTCKKVKSYSHIKRNSWAGGLAVCLFGFGGLGVGLVFSWFHSVCFTGFFSYMYLKSLQLPRWLHAKSIYAKIIANQIFANAISNCKIRVKMCTNSAFLKFYIMVNNIKPF